MTTVISTKADAELIDLSEDTSLKLNFNRRKFTQFWLSVQQTCPTISTEALKLPLPFSSSYICEVGFSGMKTKFRNKLQLSNSLRLKITRIGVDVNAVINSNRKQAHQSHTPIYGK
jgi:tRNA A37 threonylcarbamoyltransferase TsaD